MKCEKLDVLNKSARLSSNVYKAFKECKDYGFKDQITRAGLSIPSNIAEGMEKESLKELVRFLDIAKDSAAEFATQTYIGMDIGYIRKEEGKLWLEESNHILSMLSNLQKMIRNRKI